MFCPNCGTKVEAGQKYCRACGLGVEKVPGLISEQLPAGAPEGSTPEEVARLLRRKRGVERALVGVGATAGLVLVASILATIFVNMGGLMEGGIFLGLLLIGVAAVALVLHRESLKGQLAARGVSADAEKKLEGGMTTSKLLTESHFEPVPAVTDRTTELLAAERKRNTKEV